jgi:lipopolysaccharide biosynthesis protein
MSERPAAPSASVRALAFVLPQFHPTAENDAFWGPGFTEWTNVTRGRPAFAGHHQPHRPAHLGYYDLRLPETRAAQADLARAHGLHGFVYYHYWFHGRRLLARPIDDILASQAPDFPFCLCWANENWTRRWDGLDAEVLAEQRYSPDDDVAHLRWLARAFEDPRYIRIDGRPLFLVYRASRLPAPADTTAMWREEAARLGVGELYLCRVESFPSDKADPRALGFDAAVEFQPDWEHLGTPRLVEGHRVYDYQDVVARMLAKPSAPYRRFPCVMPSWDNTARRREGATIVHGASPDAYEQWLAWVASRFTPYSAEENLVFINAWNEWAEGNHLEPCERWGLGYLDATARALGHRTVPRPALAAQVAAFSTLTEVPPTPAPVMDVSREQVLTEVYNLASRMALGGERSRAATIFEVVTELSEPGSPDLAGKACFKRAQLSTDAAERRRLLERCLALCPGHLEARRQLDAPVRPPG